MDQIMIHLEIKQTHMVNIPLKSVLKAILDKLYKLSLSNTCKMVKHFFEEEKFHGLIITSLKPGHKMQDVVQTVHDLDFDNIVARVRLIV